MFPLLLLLCVSSFSGVVAFGINGAPEFVPSFIWNAIATSIYLIFLLSYREKNCLIYLSFVVFEVSAYAILQPLTTRIVCGTEWLVLTMIPVSYMIVKAARLPRKSIFIYTAILLVAFVYDTKYKFATLPNAVLFLPGRRKIFIAQEIYYTFISQVLLIYSCNLAGFMITRIDSKQTYLRQSMDYMAKHDPLTKLMNRHRAMIVFNDCEQTRISDGTNYAVAIFDIDDFKKINDTYGHDAGDFVLKTYTKRLWNKLKEPVRIGRWGGEEFIVIFPTITDNLIFALEKIRAELAAQPIYFEGKAIAVTATYGISSSRQISSPNKIITDADSMLYIGKQNGKNRLVVSEKF